MHLIQCKCGTVRGNVSDGGNSNRVRCYCADCHAFAKFLDPRSQVLDAQGGAEIVQVAQHRLRITQGLDHANLDRDFGAVVAVVSTETAIGDPKPQQRRLILTIAKFIWIVLANRISGRYKDTQLFSPTGTPIVTPRILTANELRQLKSVA
jgi:hypothetical protein